MSQDHDAVRNGDVILDHDSVLKVQKQFSTEITVWADHKFFVISSACVVAIVNHQRRSETYILTNARSVIAQRSGNRLCGHEHQRNIESVAAINCRTKFGPQSKEEINEPHS